MKRPVDFATEAELAGAFMAHLEQLGWDCYPEVSVNRGGSRADIVARKGALIWVIEAKLRFGVDVCDQAKAWIGWAHYISVLVPGGRGERNPVLTDWLRYRGIGLIRAEKETYRRPASVEFNNCVPGRLHRSAHKQAKYIAEHLHPDMKRFAPGTNGGYSSPWRRTMDASVSYVLQYPGCTLKDIVANIAHHYYSDTTARSCLLKWLEHDKRVEMRREGRSITLHPAATQAA